MNKTEEYVRKIDILDIDDDDQTPSMKLTQEQTLQELSMENYQRTYQELEQTTKQKITEYLSGLDILSERNYRKPYRELCIRRQGIVKQAYTAFGL